MYSLWVGSCMCKRRRCNYKLNKGPKDVYVQFVSASASFTHAWTPEKNRFNTYNSSIWIFSQFWLLNWFHACFQSDIIVVSHRRPPYCLCWLYKKVHRAMNGLKTQKFIELWMNQKQTGDNAIVQSKGTITMYIIL